MPGTFQMPPEAQAEFDSMNEFEMVDVAGHDPVRAQGFFAGEYWYFSAKAPGWTFEIGGNPTFTKPPAWWHEGIWEETNPVARNTTEQDVLACVLGAIKIYKSSNQVARRPGDPEYGDHILRAWSAGLVSATKVGEYYSLNVLEVIELGLAKGLPQPWTAPFEAERYIKNAKGRR